MNLIKINDLSVTYRTGYRSTFALKDINFEIQSGEYICIVGNNGSGKSTLIKGLLGLVPVTQGNITFNCARDDLSYLPQLNSIPIDFPTTVQEIVISGTQTGHMRHPFYSKKDKDRALLAMEESGISELASRRFGELSGGQRQRVLFARAICKRPKILFLDEPCTGLDPSISETFYKLLYNANQNYGTTIVMVSHDMDAVEKYASKVLVLDGELVFVGSFNEWKTKRNGRKKYEHN